MFANGQKDLSVKFATVVYLSICVCVACFWEREREKERERGERKRASEWESEWERDRERLFISTCFFISIDLLFYGCLVFRSGFYLSIYLCACVWMRERETDRDRDRERDRERQRDFMSTCFFISIGFLFVCFFLYSVRVSIYLSIYLIEEAHVL